MNDSQRSVALALVTQAQIDMLGNSLKYVYRKGDSGEQFEDLLRALDEADSGASVPAGNRD